VEIGERYAVDTNILSRISQRDDPDNGLVKSTTRALVERGIGLCFTAQSLGEFWNVSTRPIGRNGYGLSPREANDHLAFIEGRYSLLADSLLVVRAWRKLLLEHQVRGAEVHDAHIAASLEVHGIQTLITFNVSDFKRFSRMTAVHPSQIE
jgi:predicted nucleic acid-binding protein